MADATGDRFQRVLRELQAAVGADRGVALYLDDGDGALTLVAETGRLPDRPRPWHERLRLRDAANAPPLIVPVPDAAGGMVVLERSVGSDFTRDDRAVAGLYARQLADEIAVGGVLRRSSWARQLEAIQGIAGQLTRLTTVEDVGTAICRETRQVIEYDEAHVLLRGDDGALTSVAAVAVPLSEQTPPPLAEESVAGDAVRRVTASGTPLLLDDSQAVGVERPGAWSLLVVPMRFDRQVLGAVALLRAATHAFDDDDVRLLQILADQAAAATQNARLLVGRDELVRELEALLEISVAASQPIDEHALARQLAARLRQAGSMDACVISRWDEATMTLQTLAADGIDAPATTNIVDFAATRGVLINRAPRVVQVGDGDDAAAEARALADLGGQTLLMLPLSVGGRQIGLVELISLARRRTLTANEMKTFQTMAGSIAAGLENQRLLEQLRRAADIDQVTGVNNHRYLHERLRQEVARAVRTRSPLCLLMLDLDDFKPVNDRFGHAEGDHVLRSIASTIRAQVRTNDVVARYGGDEFVVVMPDTPASQAREVARRVVAGVAARRHEVSAGPEVRVGVSAGLAVYPDDGRTAQQLLQVADANMYAAKRSRKSSMPARARVPEPAMAPAAGLTPAASAS